MRCWKMLINKEKNFISAVVYVYNQEKTITVFLNQLNQCLEKTFEKYEIICVNDASSDNSIDEIKKFAKNHGEGMISILHMSFYQGLELSMNAGVDLSIGDFVYEFDSSDFVCSDKLIRDVYYHTLKGYDIVSAAPKNQIHKSSSLFYFIFNKAAKTQYMLRTESFRILSRRAINRVKSMSVVIPYRKAVYANCGLKADVIYFDTGQLMTKLDRTTRHTQRETAIDALIMYTDLAYRCSMFFSFLMMVMVVVIGLYAIFIYCSGRPVAGWTTTMLFLSGGFLGLVVILTVIIKYMSIILRLNFNRQKYIIEAIEKLK